jgi:hypothetical protein
MEDATTSRNSTAAKSRRRELQFGRLADKSTRATQRENVRRDQGAHKKRAFILNEDQSATRAALVANKLAAQVAWD